MRSGKMPVKGEDRSAAPLLVAEVEAIPMAVGAPIITAEGLSVVSADEAPGGEVLAATYLVNGVLVSEEIFRVCALVKQLELQRELITTTAAVNNPI